jgi:hypothetical protein
MKFENLAVSLLFVLGKASASNTELSCTLGKLYYLDPDAATVHTIDLDTTKEKENTPTEIMGAGTYHYTVDLSGSGLAGAYRLVPSATSRFVSVMHYGTEQEQGQDGGVLFIDGLSTPCMGCHHLSKFNATLIKDFNITSDCSFPVHNVANDHKMAIFCDGSSTDSINSTIHIVDERNFRPTIGVADKESPLVFSMTLEGAHHGVAIPVDDDHVLTSLSGEPGSLPDTFKVFDYDKNVLKQLTDVANPASSCLGLHGEAITGGGRATTMMSFACNQDHGGILVVIYGNIWGAATTSTYAAVAISYPEKYANHRTYGFVHKPYSNILVGNLDHDDSYNLVAFDPHTALPPEQQFVIRDDQVLPLDEKACTFEFELSSSELLSIDEPLLLVWTREGKLLTYMVNHPETADTPTWMLIAQTTVVPGMTTCSDTVLVPGYGGHSYVLQGSKIYDIDMVDLSNIAVTTDTLPLPQGANAVSATVASVPYGYGCQRSTWEDAYNSIAIPPVVSSLSTKKTYVVVSQEPEDVKVPGSIEQTRVFYSMRDEIARALGVSLNRIFITEVRTAAGPAKDGRVDMIFEVSISEPSPSDAVQTSASDLLKEFNELVKDPNSVLYAQVSETSRIEGEAMNDWPSQEVESPPLDDDEDDDDISSGAVAGLIVLGVLFLVSSALALIFYQRSINATKMATVSEQAQNPASKDMENAGEMEYST